MKKFEIPGIPKDYYVALKNDEGVIEYSALRGKIRQLVGMYSDYMTGVVSSGANRHTAELDVLDHLKDFLAGEPYEAKAEFMEVYEQELNAESNRILEENNEIASKVEKIKENEASFLQVCSRVGFVVVFMFILYFIFR